MDEPAPIVPATLRTPGSPEQSVIDQHELTHFPSQPWCPLCVAARGHDSPRKEQPHLDAVVPVLQFDYGYLGDRNDPETPPACFLVGADLSSGGYLAVMVPETGKQVKDAGDFNVHHVVVNIERWVRDLGHTRVTMHGDQEGVLQATLDNAAKLITPPGKDWQI